MKLNFILLLIFALSTYSFSYEHHKTRQKSQIKKNFRHHPHSATHNRHHQGRAIFPKVNGIEILHNESTHLVAFSNETAAIVFDYSSQLFAVFDGETGITIAVDVKSQTIKQINGTASGVWVATRQSFEIFFSTLQSVRQIFDQNGITSNLTNPNEVAINEINIVASHLGVDGSTSLEILIGISRTLSAQNTILRGLLRGGGHPFNMSSGLPRFVAILLGFARLFADVPGIFLDLIRTGLEVDLGAILNSSNGLEALVKVLQQYIGHLDFSKAFDRILNDIEPLLGVITTFGRGNNFNGVDNLLSVLHLIVQLSRGNISFDAFTQNSTKTGQNGGFQFNNSDLQPILNNILRIAEVQNSTYHNSEIFQGFIGLLQFLTKNDLVLNGVTISKIIDLLRTGEYGEALELIIRIIVQLNKMFNPFVAIPVLIGRLILQFLNGGNNPNIISGLDPNQLASLLQLTNENNGALSENFGPGGVFGGIISSFAHSRNNVSHILPINGLNASNPFGNAINAILGGLNGNSSGSHSNSTTPVSGIGNFVSALQSALQSSSVQITPTPESDRKFHIRKRVHSRIIHHLSKGARLHHSHVKNHIEDGKHIKLQQKHYKTLEQNF